MNKEEIKQDNYFIEEDFESPYCEICGTCGEIGCCGIRNFIEHHIDGKTNCKNEGWIISDLISLCEYKDKVFEENKQLKEMFEDSKTYTKEHLYKYNKELLKANKKLLEENKQLKEENERVREYYDTLSINGQILKDNWNKLKEYINQREIESDGLDTLIEFKLAFNQVRLKMQELEKGDNND